VGGWSSPSEDTVRGCHPTSCMLLGRRDHHCPPVIHLRHPGPKLALCPPSEGGDGGGMDGWEGKEPQS
jgi:hypothetical protein